MQHGHEPPGPRILTQENLRSSRSSSKLCSVTWRAFSAPGLPLTASNEEMASFMEGTSEEKMPLLEEGKSEAATEEVKEAEEAEVPRCKGFWDTPRLAHSQTHHLIKTCTTQGHFELLICFCVSLDAGASQKTRTFQSFDTAEGATNKYDVQ